MKTNLKFIPILVYLFTIFGCNNKIENQPLNVLWLVAEDLSPDYLSVYGDFTVPTPNIDKLASEGVVYDYAFSTSGVCAPSRATLATGVYANSFGAQNMRTMWAEPNARRSGIIDYEAVPPPNVKMVSDIIRENGYYATNNSKTDYQFEMSVMAWDESSNNAHWKNRPNSNTPFFSIFNFGPTHEGNFFSNWDDEEFLVPEDSEINIPPYLPQNSVGERDLKKVYSRIVKLDEWIGEKIKELEDEGLLEKTIVFFYSDHGGPLPRQKRLLYDSGLKVPLVIRFPDGERAGKRDNRLVSFVDFPLTVLSLAGIEPPSFMQGQAFEGEYKSKSERKYIHGHADRFDESVDMIRAVRSKKFKYFKNFNPEKPYYLPLAFRERLPSMQELLRMRDAGELDEYQALWFRKSKPEEELFDIENDPHELNNIANNPQYAEVLTAMREECISWMNVIDDKGLIEEKELIESFYPNRKARQTELPIIEISEKNVSVNELTDGSRLGYRYSSEKLPSKGWNHYNNPIDLKPNDTLEIIAHRIGYKSVLTKIYNGEKISVEYPLSRIEIQDIRYSANRPKLPPIK
ncbi:MAG: sulfatase [Flavobacteriaceae bacterium]|nr:sulfatase [Flavobacteriaceae bacterium]